MSNANNQIAFFVNTLYRKVPGLFFSVHKVIADKVYHQCIDVSTDHDEPMFSLYAYLPLLLFTCWVWEFWHASIHCSYVLGLSHSSWWVNEEKLLCRFVSNTIFCCFSATISTLALIAIASMSPETNIMICLTPHYKEAGTVLATIVWAAGIILSSIETQYWPQEVNSDPKEDFPAAVVTLNASETTPLLKPPSPKPPGSVTVSVETKDGK